MNVHYGDGGVDGKSISYGIAPLPKGERSPTKKASMHGKKGRTSGGKKEMMQRCITKIVRTKAKKEGAGHSIPVLWDPVVLAFDQNFLIFFRLFLLVGNSLLLTRSFQIL